MSIEFEKFQAVCKYQRPGYDGNGGFEPTCRKSDRRPPGLSWEKCREEYCPCFGIKVKDAKIFVEGKEVGTVKELGFVMSTK